MAAPRRGLPLLRTAVTKPFVTQPAPIEKSPSPDPSARPDQLLVAVTGVWEFYMSRGFAFPGSPGSAPPLLAQHDWVHVLADYGTTLENELSCSFVPGESSRIYLGDFRSCGPAVAEARKPSAR